MSTSIQGKAIGRPLLLVALLALLAMAILPAQAASVTPTQVPNNSTCLSVGSGAPHSTTIAPVQNGSTVGEGGVVITLLNVTVTSLGTRFDFQIAGGAAHDVIVVGTRTNHYDYAAGGGPVTSDTNLRAARGNASSVTFCYGAFPGEISGTKVDDANASATRDDGELGVAGWTIYLFGGETVQSTVTDENGDYSFEGLTPGNYVVCEAASGPGEDGWSQSGPLGPENDVCDELEIEGELASGGYAVAVESGPVTGLDFFNFQGGVELVCGEEVSVGDGTTGSFTRLDDPENPDDCAVEKNARLDIEEGPEGEDVIVFIPRGLGSSDYIGELTFVKAFNDPSLLVLQYDPDDDGSDEFRDMPACSDATFDGEGNLQSATLPNPEADSWCFASVEGQPTGEGQWEITWQVFGTADPIFR